jgi:LysR family hydrogen peroxide-inducible transcriptional activator
MTLAQLYYIVALDKFRHFGTAASNCFVTQPTLSMQIQKLEEEFGILIFDRSKQPVVPTDIGAKVIRQAKIILQESERLQNTIDTETGTFNGTLKIGVIPTISPYLVPLFLGPFVEKYPGIEIIIDEITTKEILRALHKDLIDVGILALPVNIPDFVEQTLYYEPFVAYISKKHPLYRKNKIDIDDLSRDDLLLLKEGHCLRGHVLKLCKTSEREWRENERKVLFESGSIDTLKKLVELNFGTTLLPYMAVKDIQSEEQLSLVREFNPPVPKREIGLVYNKTLLKKHFVDALYEEIQKVIPKILLEKENSLIVK